MNQNEIMYSLNSVVITVLLFLKIVLFNELGFRFGRFVQGRSDSDTKSLTGSIQGSV